MESLGHQIRSARIARDWSQRDLAQHVGVGQQAVSNWERDNSIPDHPTLALLRTALRAPLTLPPPRPVAPPDPVIVHELPLKRLSRDQFLALAQTLLSTVFSGAEVRSFKDAPSGVHFQVLTSHGDSIGVRCVTPRKFHPASFDKAVHAVAPVAKEYVLLVNTPVSAKVRKRVAATESWALWDARDISDLLLDCPASTLDAIMDLYFPDLDIARTAEGAVGVFMKPSDEA